ncbi:MAG TPA: carboxypeptidase regulatory-like domain-containing protein, partial [Candidatus Angelobacter sp.]
MKLKALFCVFLSVCFLILALPGFSQSVTAGDIAGVVSDTSGAVLPRATVTVKSDATGATEKTTTNGEGFYRFALLQPAVYTVTVDAAGFKTTSRKVAVTVGQVVTANMQMSVGAETITVEVTAPALQVESADVSTAFSNVQIAQLPNPGNDLSAIAQTAPGVVMNTGGGFGNFSSFGLPATSNLFTLNGMNDNDPFLNLNNSGATNLLLGANDLEEATITNNGYSGQYGQLAGAQVNYI